MTVFDFAVQKNQIFGSPTHEPKNDVDKEVETLIALWRGFKYKS